MIRLTSAAQALRLAPMLPAVAVERMVADHAPKRVGNSFYHGSNL